MPKPIVVFDLDGTLVDTAPDLLDSLRHSLGAGGVTFSDTTGFRGYLGNGGRALIERAFAAQNRILELQERERLYALFLNHYGANIPGKSQLYPGAIGAIERFADAGFVMAICTNKTQAFSRKLVGALGLDRHFAAVCGQDTFAFRKPDPRHLTATIEMVGADPGRALMVGDSRTDIDTAKAAGIPVVAVDFGYTDRHVREFEPSRIISHFDELTVGLVESLIASAAG
jgi:phosphoglycolate phosphatase